MTHTLQPRIHPVIRYQDAHRAVDWLARAFGFEKRAVHQAPDGLIAHAEMTFGTSVVGFSSAHALAWLERAFGFRKTFEVPGDDGAIVHAEMRFGADALMLDCGSMTESWGGLSQYLNVHVEDPDAHHERARAAGATIVLPLETKPWARGYCARDFEGLLWNFSNYKPAK